MMNARMAFSVDQIIVQIPLAFILNLIAVMPQLLEMNIFAQLLILVEQMKEIAIQMMNVSMIYCVDQAIVQNHLDLTLEQIVVMWHKEVSKVSCLNIFVTF